MLLNILEELHGALQLPSVDGLGGLACVLERNTEIGTAGASRLRRVDFGGSVSNLEGEKSASSAGCVAIFVQVIPPQPDPVVFIRSITNCLLVVGFREVQPSGLRDSECALEME